MSIPKPHKIIAVMEDGKQIPFPVLEEIYGAYICFLKRCEEYFLSSYSPPEEIHSVGDHISYEINLYLEGFSPDDRRIRELLFDCLLKRESCITGCDNMTEIDLIEMGSYIDLQGGNISLPRGYSSILEPINKNIPEEKIFTEHTVTKIKWQVDLTEEFSNKEKSGPVEVECKNGKKIRCDQVICTLPLGVLKEQASELFEPPLTVKKLKSIKNLMFGTVDKIILEYERPFLNPDISEVMLLWEKASENDESGNDVNMSWFRKIYSFTKLTDTLLLGWISGVAAEHMESLPEEEVSRICTSILRRFLKDPYVPTPRRCICTRWHSEPYTRGSYTAMAIGASQLDIECLAEPLAVPLESAPATSRIRLAFAGEHTHSYFYSTVHGAYLSGRAAAQTLLESTRWEKQSTDTLSCDSTNDLSSWIQGIKLD